jgi:endonuclease/exonuclease/phosphatase family metal-dependent hydrolase
MLVAQLGHQEDVVDTARELGMNLRYAPSMRNGALQSDRGNAILSTLPLEDVEAIELPLVLQRRVAVSAKIHLGNRTLRVVSAHLDPRGPPGHRWLGAAGRAGQAQHLLTFLRDDTVVLGADLNLGRGRYERAWRVLRDAGFTSGIPASSPTWRHTFHALPRLVLDYVLVRNPSGVLEHASVHRLDEHPRDRGPLVFGSDHHPLLARIDLASP